MAERAAHLHALTVGKHALRPLSDVDHLGDPAAIVAPVAVVAVLLVEAAPVRVVPANLTLGTLQRREFLI